MMPRVELVDRSRARNHPPATRLSRLRDSLEKLAVGLVLGKHLSDRANRILAATQREGAIPEVRRKPIVSAFLGPTGKVTSARSRRRDEHGVRAKRREGVTRRLVGKRDRPSSV